MRIDRTLSLAAAVVAASLAIAVPSAGAWQPADALYSTTTASGTWHLAAIEAQAAWNSDAATGGGRSVGRGVVVAVVDTGVDHTHPDLAGKVLPGFNAMTGRVDTDTSTETEDYIGHGTAVASIIAATADNAGPTVGVAPRAMILPIKVMPTFFALGDPFGLSGSVPADEARGVRWAVDHGADVINLSLGGERGTAAERNALQYAADHGVVVTCASGNEFASHLDYPARFDQCLAVGATTATGARAKFSNYGAGLDLVAPGVHMPVAQPNYIKKREFDYADGTSFAAPTVAGVAALLAGRGLSRDQIVTTLENTATDVGAPGYDTQTGFGQVDAARAIAAVPLVVPSFAGIATPTCPNFRGLRGIVAPAAQTSTIALGCADGDGDSGEARLLTASPTSNGAAIGAVNVFSGTFAYSPPAGYVSDELYYDASDGAHDAATGTLELLSPPDRMSPAAAAGIAGEAIRMNAKWSHLGAVSKMGGACRALSTTRSLCDNVHFLAGQTGYGGKLVITVYRLHTHQYWRAMFIGAKLTKTCLKRRGDTTCLAPAFWAL